MNCWGRFGILKSKRNSERESLGKLVCSWIQVTTRRMCQIWNLVATLFNGGVLEFGLEPIVFRKQAESSNTLNNAESFILLPLKN